MGVSVKEIVTGRKTFFVTPYIDLIPESFLEDFFVLGYECYFIENDKKIPLELKLDIILSLFPDVILFFNIDYESEVHNWPSIIRRLMNKYKNARIGVMYIKRQSKEYRAELEQLYLYEMGLKCGCIQLEYQKNRNFDIVAMILEANQAQGRRMNIRAFCPPTCTFTFEYEGNTFTGPLQDVSLSHFSILLPIDALDIPVSKKIEQVRINLRGSMIKSQVMLMAQREINGQILYVFAFVNGEGGTGLDNRTHQTLIPVIYKLMRDNTQSLLDEVYDRTKERLTQQQNLRVGEY